MSLSSLALFSIVLVASATATNKISCYNCNSESDPSCGDPIKTGDGGVKPATCTNELTNSVLNTFNAVSKGVSNILGLEKAPQANFVCLKLAYTAKSGDMEKKIVKRSCILENTKACDTVKDTLKDSSDIFCEECSTDDCNGSSSMHAAAFVLIPAMALLLATR